MPINVYGKTYTEAETKRKREEDLSKTTAANELITFPPSYNADQHPKITVTAGPHKTSRSGGRGLKRRTKRHHKKSKKHHKNKKSKKHQNKRTQKRQ